jgi:hypothetical protein
MRDEGGFTVITSPESYDTKTGTDEGQWKHQHLFKMQLTVITAATSSLMGKQFGVTVPRRLMNAQHIYIKIVTSTASRHLVNIRI